MVVEHRPGGFGPVHWQGRTVILETAPSRTVTRTLLSHEPADRGALFKRVKRLAVTS